MKNKLFNGILNSLYTFLLLVTGCSTPSRRFEGLTVTKANRSNAFFYWRILVVIVVMVFDFTTSFGLNLRVAHAADAKRIILDTDIGTDVDDAMALSLAAACPEFDIVGVTTVHADAPLRARIARKILKLAGRDDIPVIAGVSIPLKMPLPENFTWMPRLRGHEGVGILNEEELVPTKDLNANADDAAIFIIKKAKEYKGELSLITVGALSNVGRALQIEPQLADWIKEITLMGGTVYAEKFPFPPMLETNLNADPGAAEIVFASGIPITIVPMEITTQVFLTAENRAAMREWGLPIADMLVTLMEQMLKGMTSLSKEAGLSEDFYQGRTFMHDPLAIYTSMKGYDIVNVRRMHVKLEVIEQVVRTMPCFNCSPNMEVCVDVDAPAFIEFWLGRIRSLEENFKAQE